MAEADDLFRQLACRRFGMVLHAIDMGWLYRLSALLHRTLRLGVAAQLAQLTRPETWGAHCHLVHVALG